VCMYINLIASSAYRNNFFSQFSVNMTYIYFKQNEIFVYSDFES
jgi:hypothetical protein